MRHSGGGGKRSLSGGGVGGALAGDLDIKQCGIHKNASRNLKWLLFHRKLKQDIILTDFVTDRQTVKYCVT